MGRPSERLFLLRSHNSKRNAARQTKINSICTVQTLGQGDEQRYHTGHASFSRNETRKRHPEVWQRIRYPPFGSGCAFSDGRSCVLQSSRSAIALRKFLRVAS